MHRLTETTAPDLIRGQSQLHEAPDQVRGGGAKWKRYAR